MKNKPRIMVFRLKELIYTGIFILLGILLIVLMVYMFRSKNTTDNSASKGQVTQPANTIPEQTTELNEPSSEPLSSAPIETANENTYIPGVYTSSLVLSNSSMEIQVCVDGNHINSISIENMDEAVPTMYPLMENSMNDISNQIVNSQSLENITYSQDSQYTYMILLDAIETTLNKARKTN